VAVYFKYHALGNDYLVIDPARAAIALTPTAIRLLCDRHRGVGGDGVLYGPLREDGRLAVRIFNADGSEAEKSGNGLRIFARYLLEAGYVDGLECSVATIAGDARIHFDTPDGRLSTVDMGRLTFSSREIPVAGPPRQVLQETIEVGGRTFEISAASLGNPHCVVFVDEPNRELACTFGPLLEQHPLFPRRANVQFARVLDAATLQIEIWERGSGYTLASGSSSCAAAGVAYRLGQCAGEVVVHMPGGTTRVWIDQEWRVRLQGPVASVGWGQLTEEFLARLRQEV